MSVAAEHKAAPDRPGSSSPKVTIGMMVHNEERWLAEALESLLEQSWPDLEIVITDNASDDGTRAIAERFAARDPRIRYIRHERNLGAIENLHQAVRAARGEYFTLAGGHDRISANYVAGLVEALEKDRRAVLAFGRTAWIDEEGRAVERPQRMFLDMSGVNNPVARFNLVMWWNQDAIYGLVRTDALRRTHLSWQVLATGAVLLGELAVLGRFLHVPEVTWHRRINRDRESGDERVDRYLASLFTRPRRRFLPHWRIPLTILASVLTLELPRKHRLRTRLLLALSAVSSIPRYWSLMAGDVFRLLGRGRARPGKSRPRPRAGQGPEGIDSGSRA